MHTKNVLSAACDAGWSPWPRAASVVFHPETATLVVVGADWSRIDRVDAVEIVPTAWLATPGAWIDLAGTMVCDRESARWVAT